MKQKLLTGLVVFIAHLLAFQSAHAYPDRPIKLVVPSPAGALQTRLRGSSPTRWPPLSGSR